VHFLEGEQARLFLLRFVRRAHLSRVKIVVTFHHPPEILRERGVSGDLLRWVDRIVLVSPTQLPFFLPHVPEDRIDVILHGVDIEFFSPLISGKEARDFRCVTVGHWLREWNVLRQVASALPEVIFDVVPAGRQIDFGGLANVHLHRSIDDSSLAEVYRSADVLLLPLIDATANNALLEGMASGLPVVVTDLPAIRAYLPDCGGVFVPNNSVDGFIAALQSLQRDTRLRHVLGRSARARAEELAWPRIAREYETLYRTVLTRQAAEV
jgi:glycosyltransferase involved in cell wall biosynthesis